MEPVETYKLKDGRVLEIYYDEDASNPRKEFDNLGTMICFHRRYDLGDEHDYSSDNFESWNELESQIRRDNNVAVILPLYMYDHGVQRIKVGSFQGLLPQGHAEFDSGMIGFIFVTKQKVRAEYSAKRISKKLLARVEGYLRSEVETYDQYTSGQVYGFIVREAPTVDEDGEEAEGEEIDSCWGFYGSDPKANGIADHVPGFIS